MQQPTCVVCCAPRVTREPFYYEWRDRRWWIMRCATCTHQFVYPTVTAEEQALIYGDGYFSKEGDWSCGCFADDYVSSESELRKEADSVLDMLPVRAGKLLDIGCAGGFFLDQARRRGFEVIGIEYNATMADHARRKLGLRVVQAAIESVPADSFSAEFDAITLLDCLEHIPQPRDVLERASRWTVGGGALLIRGPLANDPVAHVKERARRLLRRTKQLAGYPLDANSFNKRSLGRLLTDYGFVVRGWLNETKGFANLLAERKQHRA
jgi:2-polyprenyl-3-methyl-5-hydroxy-6-metoxy-1,4-benzoquinol methylase